MAERYKERIAVGVDIKNGMVATHGWTKVSDIECFDFCRKMADYGVKTIICTDISKDGLLSGTNLELYKKLNELFSLDIVASGGGEGILNWGWGANESFAGKAVKILNKYGFTENK